MDPETARIEHLKLIQAVITRLARNSFAIKSTTAAASAALIAFMATTGSPIASVGGAAILPLWLLDASYLKRERSFRLLYDQIRSGPPPGFGTCQYFTMDVTAANEQPEGMLRVAASMSLSLLYLPLFILVGLSGLITAA